MDIIFVKNKNRDMQKYGNFYILKCNWPACPDYKFALIAEDFSWLDCNGNTGDVLIAIAVDKNQLMIWAACNGIDISDTKAHTKIRQRISLENA